MAASRTCVQLIIATRQDKANPADDGQPEATVQQENAEEPGQDTCRLDNLCLIGESAFSACDFARLHRPELWALDSLNHLTFFININSV